MVNTTVDSFCFPWRGWMMFVLGVDDTYVNEIVSIEFKHCIETVQVLISTASSVLANQPSLLEFEFIPYIAVIF